MRQYVSLHNHTIGSIGDSLITPKQLIEATQEAGQTAVAVTDHGSMSRLWETYKVAKKAGIKLIAGCEIYFVDASNEEDTTLSHLVLLAKNQKGYQNLLTLNKRGFDQQNANVKRAISRIDWKLLEQFHEGLICTSACGNGLIAQYIMHDMPDAAEQAAKRLSQIFGDDFALELQPHNLQRRPSAYSGPVNQQKINLALKKMSEKLGIRCIVATDAHYVKQAHHKAHDVYLCNASGQPITSGNRLRYDNPDFYVKNGDEVYEHFTRHIKVWGEEFVESLFANTIYYADRCEDAAWISPEVMTGEKSQLPEFPFKDEPDYEQFKVWKADDSESDIKQFKKSDVPEDAQFYRYRTQVGLEKKIGQGKIPESDLQECIQQSLEEFDVFEYRGFSSYMLITADFLKWCRRNMIAIGPGRGSVGGSLTAYVNEIHQAYPKKYQLIFARFLNKYKEAFPDIDNDIAPSGRDKLHNYLRSKYGEGSVAHVSNVNTITPKVYARDIARVFEFDGSRSAAAEKGNLIADSIPAEMKSVKQALEEAPLFAEYAKQYPELAEFAELLCGLPRAWSTHAGGIVISKRPLEGLVPLRRDASGALVLEYDKEIAEENGLVKIDTLGLETLDIIGETYNIIKDTGKEMPADPFDYEIMDSMSYNLIGDGDTFGVFQLGSTAIPVCKKVRPQNVADIALVSALVRPAAKDTIPDLLKVRNGETKMNLMHPTLERAFASTYGYGLYEESLMYLAQDVAGWDLHDADKLRKLTKEKGKNPEKVKKWREEFIEGAQKNKGLSEEIATRVWDETIAQFGGYGFNRSHATLYSMISFHTAYLKANYPVEFLVANLMSEVRSNAKSAKDNIMKIKTEIRNKKVKIVPPHVNHSELSWKIVNDNTLMTGLDSLRGIGKDAIPNIIENRPFKDYQDLIFRTDTSKVRSTSIQAMAASGSLDDFGMDRKVMFHYASDYRAKLRSHMEKLYKAHLKSLDKLGWKFVDDNGDFPSYWVTPSGEKVSVDDCPKPTPEQVQEHLVKFKYPFPKEKPWTVQEMFAMEEHYMGEGISGDTFERYPGFFDRKKTVPFEALKQMFPWEAVGDDERTNRKANTHYLGNHKIRPLEGVVTSVFSFTVKKEDSPIFGQEMARLSIQDPWGDECSLLCFPEAWDGMKSRLKELSGNKQEVEPGIAIRFLGSFQWENEASTSFVLSDILDYKAPPSLPEDRASKKVKMPRAKTKAKDLNEMELEEMLDVLEDEMLGEGLSTVNDPEDIDSTEAHELREFFGADS